MNAELKIAPLVQQLTLVDCKVILKFWDKIQEWMTKDQFNIYIYIESFFCEISTDYISASSDAIVQRIKYCFETRVYSGDHR